MINKIFFIFTGCLQELERHMEEFHPDRGDTQRSVFVYQNLTVASFLKMLIQLSFKIVNSIFTQKFSRIALPYVVKKNKNLKYCVVLSGVGKVMNHSVLVNFFTWDLSKSPQRLRLQKLRIATWSFSVSVSFCSQ